MNGLKNILFLATIILGLVALPSCQRPEYKRPAKRTSGSFESNWSTSQDQKNSNSGVSQLKDQTSRSIEEQKAKDAEELKSLEEEAEVEIDQEMAAASESQENGNQNSNTGNAGETPDNPTPTASGPLSPYSKCLRQYQGAFSSDIVVDGKVGPIAYHVTGDGQLSIKFAKTKAIFKMEATLLTARPAMARDEAKRRMEGQSGTRILTFLSDDELTALKEKNPAWAKITCSIAAVKSQTFVVEGSKGVVEYEPALPFTVIPTNSNESLDAEIDGDLLDFGEVKVKFIEVPAALRDTRPGDIVSGHVALRKLDPKALKIPSDRAYRFEYDFGAPNRTYDYGLVGAWAEYLIDTTRHSYRAIVIPLQATEDTATDIIFQ